jgi:transcriptional regulator with XRE-family HTH domain
VTTQNAGDLLRHWRLERRLSQLELAGRAETSTRHLSFIETGRATPSRTMLVHLCEQLEVPLRERNRLLLAAGYAPVYGEPSLDSLAMAPVRDAMRQLLVGLEPFPALAIDQNWNIVDVNAGMALMLEGIDPALFTAPANALRLSLHPDGMAGRIINLAEWRGHLFERMTRGIEATGSPELIALLAELREYPGGEIELSLPAPDQVVVPLRLRHDGQELSFISATTVFGTAMNVTVAELAIESFYPADAATKKLLTSAPS